MLAQNRPITREELDMTREALDNAAARADAYPPINFEALAREYTNVFNARQAARVERILPEEPAPQPRRDLAAMQEAQRAQEEVDREHLRAYEAFLESQRTNNNNGEES